MTTRIPTAKTGHVYRGPRTWRQVLALSDEIWESAPDKHAARAEWIKLAAILDDAGFTGLAARLRSEYDLPVTH